MGAGAGEIVVKFAEGVVGVGVEQSALGEGERFAGEAAVLAVHREGMGVVTVEHVFGADDGFDVAVGAEGGFGAVGEGFDQETVRFFDVTG